jgi:predicted HAD superfamily Cof-like phosphohydrolase
MKSNYFRTVEWLSACGKEPRNEQHLSVQIGCHLEETVEFLNTVYIESTTGISSNALQEVAAILSAIGNNLKRGHATAKIFDKEAALDALCDCEVTGNGVAFLAGFDKAGADEAVLASNEAKLVDGKPVIKEGGKIGKPDGWAPPDLTPFLPKDAA